MASYRMIYSRYGENMMWCLSQSAMHKGTTSLMVGTRPADRQGISEICLLLAGCTESLSSASPGTRNPGVDQGGNHPIASLFQHMLGGTNEKKRKEKQKINSLPKYIYVR